MNLRAVFILLTVLAVLSPAQARGGYIGLGIGQSEINHGQFDETGTGFKVFGGFQTHPYFAIEAAYMNFGEPSENRSGTEKEYEACAAAIWAKGFWPITRSIDLLGKAGWAYWEAESYTTPPGNPTVKQSWEGNDFAWGLGASFNPGKKLSIQLEYEEVNNDLDKTALWSVSGLYRF